MFQILEMTEARVASVTPTPRSPVRSRKLPYGLLQKTADGKRQHEHVVIAERAIGGPLPVGAEIHHIDENPMNNAPSNLVVCPDAAYHKLLHQRQRAFDACGHYDWRRCHICKRYDAPENLWTSRKKAHHRACDAARAATYRQQQKGTASV